MKTAEISARARVRKPDNVNSSRHKAIIQVSTTPTKKQKPKTSLRRHNASNHKPYLSTEHIKIYLFFGAKNLKKQIS